ncbi:MAG TPA: peroxidase family protein, partial [Flavisolibacter sp.]|nr:peroxidase family protein [Flavisolibacter sp.]
MATKKTSTKKGASKKAASKKNVSAKSASTQPVSKKGAAKTPVKKAAAKTSSARTATPSGNRATAVPATQELLLSSLNAPQAASREIIKMPDLEKRLIEFNVRPKIDLSKMLTTVNKINTQPLVPVDKLPEDIKKSIQALKPGTKRFHGTKISLAWFPFPWVKSPCADKFCYMSSAAVRMATALPFNLANQVLMGKLGDMMGDPGRETSPDSTIPAGFTYVGQFIDHDITFDVSSSLDTPTDATTINNMRSPALDLDSLYGRGPALDPFLFVFPSTGPSTAIKFQLGTNRNTGPGGPGGTAGIGGMQVQTDFDVPRVHNLLNPALSSNTAIIGDPRNDENLIIVQFHQTMLRFHNQVVDMLLLAGFAGDIFVEAKKIVTQHYQWAVVNDYLKRVCGTAAVTSALSGVTAAIGSAFCMPVEFSVAAYRFGHSQIR